MRKISILFLSLLLGVNTITYAQVEDIIDDARSNDLLRDQLPSNGGGSGGGSCVGTASVYATSACTTEIISLIASGVTGLGILQRQALRLDESENPYIISLEGGVHTGVGLLNGAPTFMIRPEVKFNWGIFGTKVRVSHLQDPVDGIQNVNWQFLTINFVPLNNFNMQVGYGATFEMPTRNIFGTYSGTIAVHNNDHSTNAYLEGRIVRDRITNVHPLQEVSFRVDRKFNETSKINVHLSAGLSFQRYYWASPNSASGISNPNGRSMPSAQVGLYFYMP